MSYKECAGGSCGLFLEKLLRRGELLFSEAGEQRHDPLAVCPSQRALFARARHLLANRRTNSRYGGPCDELRSTRDGYRPLGVFT